MIYSYTSFNCYENCPKQFYYRYIAKALPFVETEQMAWGKRVHTAFERRLQWKEALPPPLAPLEPICAAVETAPYVAVEQTWIITRDGRPATRANGFLTSRCDVGAFDGDREYAYLIDWKTGKPREDDTELCFQGIALRCHYPSVRRVRGAYCWIKESRVGVEHDLTLDMDSAWTRLCEVVDLIAIQTRDGEKGFPAKPGKHFPCPYCAATFCPFRES